VPLDHEIVMRDGEIGKPGPDRAGILLGALRTMKEVGRRAWRMGEEILGEDLIRRVEIPSLEYVLVEPLGQFDIPGRHVRPLSSSHPGASGDLESTPSSSS